MTSRSILQVFENYQKSRLAFAQTISDLATRPQNVELMKGAHVLGKRRIQLNMCRFEKVVF